MKTKEEILSEVSGEGLGTLGIMLQEEPNMFRFSITEVYKAMQEYADQQLRFYSVVSSLPTREEILRQARKEENYIGNECDIVGAEKSGKYHGFLKGVEWLSNTLK